MQKKRKHKIHMVDMSGRLNLEIFPATIEEEEIFRLELTEIEISVEKRMSLYEKNLKEMIISVMSEPIVTTTEQDSLYFIEKYEEFIKNRNSNNIKNRLEQYQLYLKGQDD